MDKCEWIYARKRYAHTNCGDLVYLSKSLSSPEECSLDLYDGLTCPVCGKTIKIPNNAYDLLYKEKS